ncbi:hypothetical protein [Nakamurella sp.]|uniref:hypothetical protein n=1 Tax=Nakamurella sp. TaxID=1869182 RepID=UPI0037846B7A
MAVGIAASAALVLAAGWSWAVGSTGPAALTDGTVSAQAVVVSSLACQNGDEGTVVDLLGPVDQPPGTTRRATIDSCGHRPGEVLRVEYSAAHPDRVVPTAVVDGVDDPSGRLLPLGLILAGLLGAAAVAVVVRDARRPHRPDVPAGAGPQGTGHGRHARPDEDEPAVPIVPVLLPVDRPHDLDLLFPAHQDLRESLHDELFTHRSAAGV